MADTVQILKISNEDYHARPEWSSSQIKLLPKDPMLFEGRHITKTMPFKRTPAMILGTKVHRILLDGAWTIDIPDYVLSKVGSTNTNAYRTWEHELFSNCPVEERPVPVKEDDPIKHMVASLRAHKTVHDLLASSVFREQSIIWSDPITGLGLRARLDDVAHYNDRNVLWDLKTANDISPYACDKQIATLGYHRSLDWYATGLAKAGDQLEYGGGIDVYLIVWVQSSAPYYVAVDELDDDTMSTAAQENSDARDELRSRLQADERGDPGAWQPDNYHLIRRKAKLPDWYKEV